MSVADDRAEDRLSAPEVRQRAVVGAVVDVIRSVAVRLIAVAGTIVTARLLTPYDFGQVAVGTTVLAFGSFLDDGGIGVALIRRSEAPTKRELQALLAFQLGIDVLIVIVIGLVMLPFKSIGLVTTVIVASLPFGAFRAPAYIIYERRLDYRPMAMIEVVENTVYYVWAIATISIGWGVWGLASAYAIRELTGASLTLIRLPEGRVVPVPSWTAVRPILGFGVRVQAVGLLHMLRDQGVNIIVAASGGIAMLGLWGVAWRIIQIPMSLFQALWRVSFPGMSQLLSHEDEVGATLERIIALVAIGTGVLVAPLAASCYAWVTVLMGERWSEAATAIPPVCFGLSFGVPISVALSGFLWASGLASVPLRATAVGIPATLLTLVILLPLVGVTAAGIACIAASTVESVFFVYATKRRMKFEIGARLFVPISIAALAGGCGWLVERSIGPTVVGAIASSLVALATYLAGLAAVHRSDLVDACSTIMRGLRGAVAAPATA